MPFFILLCHVSMYYWNDSSFMSSASLLRPSWWSPQLHNESPRLSSWVWGIGKHLTEQDQVNRWTDTFSPTQPNYIDCINKSLFFREGQTLYHSIDSRSQREEQIQKNAYVGLAFSHVLLSVFRTCVWKSCRRFKILAVFWRFRTVIVLYRKLRVNPSASKFH